MLYSRQRKRTSFTDLKSTDVESFSQRRITMFVPRSSQMHTGYHVHTTMADKPDVRPVPFIPTVYEHVTPEPLHWEYHVLTIDSREDPLPDAEQLNALG